MNFPEEANEKCKKKGLKGLLNIMRNTDKNNKLGDFMEALVQEFRKKSEGEGEGEKKSNSEGKFNSFKECRGMQKCGSTSDCKKEFICDRVDCKKEVNCGKVERKEEVNCGNVERKEEVNCGNVERKEEDVECPQKKIQVYVSE